MDAQQFTRSPRTTSRPVVPILFHALLDHAKVCKPCHEYLHRSPLDDDAAPCDNGRRCLVSIAQQPTPLTVESVLDGIERLAAATFPECLKCHRLIRKGELVDSQGHYHLDCSAPAVRPFDEVRAV
jgi:hypothetical protein